MFIVLSNPAYIFNTCCILPSFSDEHFNFTIKDLNFEASNKNMEFKKEY